MIYIIIMTQNIYNSISILDIYTYVFDYTHIYLYVYNNIRYTLIDIPLLYLLYKTYYNRKVGVSFFGEIVSMSV